VTDNSRLTVICDSFQDKRFPLELPHNFIDSFFFASLDLDEPNYSDSVSVHIRLTDFLDENPFDSDYYADAISKYRNTPVNSIDVFSDDLEMAKRLIDFDRWFLIRWPEENHILSPYELLYVLSNYKYIIASKSSLSWWSSFIAWRKNSALELTHPWDYVEDFVGIR
jgi:hypothetical protein